jgi:1-acyl-sn-glycerol-3-phosphate acyltransferase
MAKIFRKFIYKFVIKLSAFIFVSRTEVKGMGNLPKKGGFIIAANHINVLDPFVMVGIMKNFLWKHYMGRGKKIYCIGNIKLKKNRIYAFFTEEEFGFIPNTKEGFFRTIKLLSKGNIVIILPEGGVNLKDYIVKGKKGVAHMAMLSGVSVIPAAFIGQLAVTFSQGMKALFKPKKLIFGSSMSFPRFNHLSTSVVIDKIMCRIAELAKKEYRMDIKHVPYKKLR